MWNYSSEERSERDKKYISWLQSPSWLPASVSPGTKQNNLLAWSDLWRHQPLLFSTTEVCKNKTDWYLPVEPVICCKLRWLIMSLTITYPACSVWLIVARRLPVAIYFLARRSEHSSITLQTMHWTPLSSHTSLHHSPHTSYQTPVTPV